MAILSAQSLGGDLCTALGLDPKSVTGITLDCQIGEMAIATVRLIANNDGYTELIDAVKRFELRELED